MPDLIPVPRDKVPEMWPWVRERVQHGVDRSHDRMTVEGLYAKAESGEWDLHFVWASDDEATGEGAERVLAVLLTQLYREMGGDIVCAVRFIAGANRAEWLWLIEALELYAVQNGCTLMSIPGRRAWARELKDFDYRQTAVILEKRLKPKASIHAGRQANHGSDRAADRPARAAAV